MKIVRQGFFKVIVGLACLSGAPMAHSYTWSGSVALVGPATDTFEFFVQNDTGAGPFASPGAQFNSPAGWTVQLINPGYVLASGPSASSWNFDFFFGGNVADSVQIDGFGYGGGLGGSLLGSFSFLFSNGVVTSFGGANDPTGRNYDRTPVPEPGTLALLGLGLAGLGLSRRRRAPN